MIKYIKNLASGDKFLLTMILVYVAWYSATPIFITNSFKTFLKEFISLFPMLAFFFFIIFIINCFIKPEFTKRYLGHESGIKGWAYAILGSVLVAIPPYVAFPMLKELKNHGMNDSLIAVFLNNRNVQPAFLLIMAYYFSWQFTIVISVYILIFAVLNAIILNKIMDKF